MTTGATADEIDTLDCDMHHISIVGRTRGDGAPPAVANTDADVRAEAYAIDMS